MKDPAPASSKPRWRNTLVISCVAVLWLFLSSASSGWFFFQDEKSKGEFGEVTVLGKPSDTCLRTGIDEIWLGNNTDGAETILIEPSRTLDDALGVNIAGGRWV